MQVLFAAFIAFGVSWPSAGSVGLNGKGCAPSLAAASKPLRLEVFALRLIKNGTRTGVASFLVNAGLVINDISFTVREDSIDLELPTFSDDSGRPPRPLVTILNPDVETEMKLKIREQMTAMRKEKIKSFEHKGSDLLAYSGLGISEIRVVPASGPGPRGVSAFAEVVLNGSLTFCGIGIVHSGAEPTVYMPSRIRDSGRRYDVVCAYRDTARSELKKAVFNEYIEASKHRD